MKTPVYTILVIDDDPEDCELAAQIVGEEPDIKCKVEFCADGEKALEYLYKAQRQPRLIVSDINMPGMNGLELQHIS